MILKQTVYLYKYNWDVIIYYNNLCTSDIINSLINAGCVSKHLHELKKFLKSDRINTGFIYSNPILRESVIVIGKSENLGQFINTLEHEKNHLEMHICKADEIDPFSEEAAILSGEISQIFLDQALSTIVSNI